VSWANIFDPFGISPPNTTPLEFVITPVGNILMAPATPAHAAVSPDKALCCEKGAYVVLALFHADVSLAETGSEYAIADPADVNDVNDGHTQ
jgi:hypothetical protein